jgi:hypothetical protein
MNVWDERLVHLALKEPVNERSLFSVSIALALVLCALVVHPAALALQYMQTLLGVGFAQ